MLGRCAVPWAADESLAIHGRIAAAPRAIRGAPRSILKPAILGSLLVARDLALQARAHGKSAVVTHLFDGPIALAAAAELALSLPRPRSRPASIRTDRLGDWPAIVVPQLARRGVVLAAKTPAWASVWISEATRGSLRPRAPLRACAAIAPALFAGDVRPLVRRARRARVALSRQP